MRKSERMQEPINYALYHSDGKRMSESDTKEGAAEATPVFVEQVIKQDASGEEGTTSQDQTVHGLFGRMSINIRRYNRFPGRTRT